MSRFTQEEKIVLEYVNMMTLREIQNAQNGLPSNIIDKMEFDNNTHLIGDLKSACYDSYREYLEDSRFEDMHGHND